MLRRVIGNESTRSLESPPPDVDASGEKAARRKWLHVKEHRTGVKVDKDLHVGMEFCNGYLGTSTRFQLVQPSIISHSPLAS